MDLAIELQRICNSEVNVRIGWFWDCGIEVRLGDEMNGFLAEETVRSVSEILPWLQEAIAHFYPTSIYAASLDSDIRERAATRLFLKRWLRHTSSRSAVRHPIAVSGRVFRIEVGGFPVFVDSDIEFALHQSRIAPVVVSHREPRVEVAIFWQYFA
jgi:hypothetical protein